MNSRIPAPGHVQRIMLCAAVLSLAASSSLAQCNTTMHEFFNVGVVPEKPFLAERIEIHVYGQKDGLDRLYLYKSSLARDAEGRVRIETWLLTRNDEGETRQRVLQRDFEAAQMAPENGPDAWHQISHYVEQFDCSESRLWTVNISRRRIHMTDIPKPDPKPDQNQPIPPPYGAALRQQAQVHPDWDLGSAAIAGIEARGAKTFTSAGEGDSNKTKLDHEDETWASQEWALVLRQYYRNPRLDKLMLMEVTAFRQQDPGPDIFKLPSDYTHY